MMKSDRSETKKKMGQNESQTSAAHLAVCREKVGANSFFSP